MLSAISPSTHSGERESRTRSHGNLVSHNDLKGVTFVYRPASLAQKRARRCFDFLVASLALCLAFPILSVACIAIMIEDGGSPIFSQKRVGRFGRLFTIHKLRTMYRNNCGDALKPRAGDRRITRVGALLRRTSIDELPQLWNVVRGDMALVGPRPEMPFVVERYQPWQHLRHLVTPGITGLWQVTCRSEIPLERPEATLLDLQYIENLSVAADARIIANTFRSVLFAKGAY